MNVVRAKFKVDSIKHSGTPDQPISDVEMSPVVSSKDNAENASFWKWTPNGNIKMTCLNAQAASLFTPGREYFIDFSPAS